MASLTTDLHSFPTTGPQPPATSAPQPQHDTHDILALEEEHLTISRYSQATAPNPHFVPQIESDELRQDIQLAYNAILVGRPIPKSPPPTRPLKSSNKHLRKRAGPFIPGVLRGGKARSFAGNIAAPLRLDRLAAPRPLEVPQSSPLARRADLIVKRLSASPPPEVTSEIDIAPSPEVVQLAIHHSSTASFDVAPGMTRSASYPRSAPVPDPHRGAALIDSRWVPMQRSTSAPVDYNSHTRRSSFYRGYTVGAHVRNSAYANHNSLRGTPLEPVPRHLSSSLAHASASLYVNVPPGSTSFWGTGPPGAAQSVLLHPAVRRWGGSEVPLHTIANNIDGILKQRSDREQEKRKGKMSSVEKLRDDGNIRHSTDNRASKSGPAVLPGAHAEDSDADEGPAFGSLAAPRPFKSSSRANVKGHQIDKAKNDVESDESENMAPTITMTRSGRHSRSVTFKNRMPSLVMTPTVSHQSDSSGDENTATIDKHKARKRVKILHRSSHERPASNHRADNDRELKQSQASMKPPKAGLTLPSASSGSGSTGKNDLFPRRIFGKGRDNSRPPPRRDGEPECMKHRYQPARFVGDLYTPAIVRAGKSAGRGSAAGSAGSKEGWCGLCPPATSATIDTSGGGDRKKAETGGWLNLRNSSYRYHLIRQHGISPKTFMPFVEPVETVRRNPMVETRVGDGTELKGQCGTCGKWIVFGLKEATNYYVHAAKCHREVAPPDEEGEAEEEDQATNQGAARAQAQAQGQTQAGSSKQDATSSSSGSTGAVAGRATAVITGAKGLSSSDDSG